MIRVTRDITIDEKDLDIASVRASGPGGQNVNKLSTAAQLRFDVNRITLAPDVMTRLTVLAGQRMTKDGVIVIEAGRFRTQEQNRDAVLSRLREMLIAAIVEPLRRKKTKPSRAAKQRRLSNKKARSEIKNQRSGRHVDHR